MCQLHCWEAYQDCEAIGVIDDKPSDPEAEAALIASIEVDVFGTNKLLTATEYMRRYVSHPHWRALALEALRLE
jgi:hypothetical protein